MQSFKAFAALGATLFLFSGNAFASPKLIAFTGNDVPAASKMCATFEAHRDDQPIILAQQICSVCWQNCRDNCYNSTTSTVQYQTCVSQCYTISCSNCQN